MIVLGENSVEREKAGGKVRAIRPRKRNATPVFGLWLFLLFCCLLASYFFIHSPYFSLQNIQVQGYEVLPAEKIIEMSGITTGINIFRTDNQGAITKLMMHPSIKKAEITRKLPSTLAIKITERTPAALVVGQDGFIVVDEEGVYIKKVSDLQGMHLPLISGVEVDKNHRPGANISTQGLSASIKLISLMDKTLQENVSEIMAPTPYSLTLKTIQGVEVRFGEPVELERKLKIIEELLLDNGSVINSQTVEYIDLRYNAPPVIKRKN